jgi:hypothetical protein
VVATSICMQSRDAVEAKQRVERQNVTVRRTDSSKADHKLSCGRRPASGFEMDLMRQGHGILMRDLYSSERGCIGRARPAWPF